MDQGDMSGMGGGGMGDMSGAGMGGAGMGGGEHQHAAYMSFTCAGIAWVDAGDTKTGSWAGHILAGIALLVWALHWNFGAYRAWLVQTKQKPYRGQTTYAVPLVPPRLPLEALLKVLVPLAAIFGNLISLSGWVSDMCPEHSPRKGRFDPQQVSHYANVWVLVAFLASGAVDLLGWLLELPSGTQQFFTSAAFMLHAFILSQGQHGDMLAGMVYYLLFMVAAGTALFMLAEAMWPESFLAACGKVYCLYLQAVFYFAAARILYENRPAWDSFKPLPDMAPSMFVPVPLVFWMNLTSLFMFIGYLVMRAVLRSQGFTCAAEDAPVVHHHHHHSEGGEHGPGYRAVARAPAKDANGVSELVPLTSRHFTLK